MMKNLAVATTMALALMVHGTTARAAEIKVLSAGIMRIPLTDLAPNFERMSGNKLAITYDFSAAVTARIEKGEKTDVVILPKPDIAALVKAKKILPASVHVIARSGLALGVHKGTPKPDISSPAAVKKVLLAAKSIAYFDPATGALDGTQFRRVIERLGIAKQVSAKAKLWKTPGDTAAEKDAEIFISQPPALLASANYDMVGMLPAPMQDPERFTWAAGAAATAADPETADDLIRFLAAPGSAGLFKAKGMPPR